MEASNEDIQLLQMDQSQKSMLLDTKQPLRTTFYSAWIQEWWLLEIISLLIGTGSIIAICIVLRHYQDQPSPRLNSIIGVGITLNTIIAILTTAGRVFLLIPVAECISQQKWAWFSGSPKPVTDLETFDRGSRSTWGSLVLLWTVNVQ